MLIGIFDNKQKKKKVNKKENVQEKKDKELSFYYNTIISLIITLPILVLKSASRLALG